MGTVHAILVALKLTHSLQFHILSDMNPLYFRLAGIELNVVGALVLAIRVTMILDALCGVAAVHEANIQQLMPTTKGDIYNFRNARKQVEKARRLGTWTLAVGFVCIALGNALDGLALLLSRS